MCVMKKQVLVGYVTAQLVFVVVLTNYVVYLIVPYSILCNLVSSQH